MVTLMSAFCCAEALFTGLLLPLGVDELVVVIVAVGWVLAVMLVEESVAGGVRDGPLTK